MSGKMSGLLSSIARTFSDEVQVYKNSPPVRGRWLGANTDGGELLSLKSALLAHGALPVCACPCLAIGFEHCSDVVCVLSAAEEQPQQQLRPIRTAHSLPANSSDEPPLRHSSSTISGMSEEVWLAICHTPAVQCLVWCAFSADSERCPLPATGARSASRRSRSLRTAIALLHVPCRLI